MLRSFLITAWRNLVRNKVSATFNITGLAIGIAVCLLIGTWLKHELSFDTFHPQQVYRVYNTFKSESESFTQAGSCVALGAHLPDELSSVKEACRMFRWSYRIKNGETQNVEEGVRIVDGNFLQMFGFKLTHGDASTALTAINNIVLTTETAARYFGTADEAMGKHLDVNGQQMVVTGIVDNRNAISHIEFDILVPYATLHDYATRNGWGELDDQWVGGWPYVYVTLENDDRWKEIEGQITDVVRKHAEKEWADNKMSYQYFLQRVEDIHLKSHLRYDAPNNGNMSTVLIFAAIAVVVLLLACINYINLSTAGAALRAKETSVKKVVGASRGQLIRQFFLETFVMCTLAVAIGLAAFYLTLQPLASWLGQELRFEFSVNALLVAVGFISFITLVSGLYPAAVLSSFNPAETLKGSFIRSARGNVLRKGLVVFQFTVTIALIASIMIIQRQMEYIQNKSLGYDADELLVVDYDGEESVVNNFNTIRNDLLKSPHILNVSRHSGTVVGGLGNGWTTTINLKGEEISTSLYRMSVDPDYFATYDMQLAAGRFFRKDTPADSNAVLVNEAAVKTFGWETAENAIGKPFGRDPDKNFVIGVVKDFNFENLHKRVEALMLQPVVRGNALTIKVDAANISAAIDQLGLVWKQYAPDIPLRYSFVDESTAQQYGAEQRMGRIFYGFSFLSLFIGCLGLLGLAMFIVQQRTKEIGIRKVLGADVVRIMVMLTGEFSRLVLLSALIATPLAWYLMSQWLGEFAYRTDMVWWIFLLAGSIALAVALLTVGIQAFKAAMLNPVKSLRME
jgi:putative ABC transport system permease protein